MNEFIAQIEAQVAQLKVEGEKFFEKGNKAAGTRVRLTAMDITKSCKALREDVLKVRNKA